MDGSWEQWWCLHRPERIAFFRWMQLLPTFYPSLQFDNCCLHQPATAHHYIWCKMLLDLLTLLTLTVAISLLNDHNDIFCWPFCASNWKAQIMILKIGNENKTWTANAIAHLSLPASIGWVALSFLVVVRSAAPLPLQFSLLLPALPLNIIIFLFSSNLRCVQLYVCLVF